MRDERKEKGKKMANSKGQHLRVAKMAHAVAYDVRYTVDVACVDNNVTYKRASSHEASV